MPLSYWEQAVLLTVAYTDQFAYPLTLAEIRERLVKVESVVWAQRRSSQAVEKRLLSKAKFSQVINQLVSKKRLFQTNGLVGLKGSERFVTTRHERAVFSEAKWQEVSTVIWYMQRVPWITGVAVTGSLAMNNAKQYDDSDFLIITQPGRLWLSRLWLMVMTAGTGKRRSWHGEERNSWCFNMWLDENHLAMPETHQNVYAAYEVIQAKWIVGQGRVEALFKQQNAWVNDFLWHIEGGKKPGRVAKKMSGVWQGFLALLEAVAFWSQYRYMKRHMTREKVGTGLAFFHPRDTRSQVEKQWQKALKNVYK